MERVISPLDILCALVNAGIINEQEGKTAKEGLINKVCDEHESCDDCPVADECIPFAEVEVNDDGDVDILIEVDDDDKEDIEPDCSECWSAGIPCVDRIIFSDPATIVFWTDGTKTKVKCMDGEKFERYAGFCAAVMKKLFGSTSAAKAYMEDRDAESIAKARQEEKEKKAATKKSAEDKADKDYDRAFHDAVAEEIFRRMVNSEADRMMADENFMRIVKGHNDETPAK